MSFWSTLGKIGLGIGGAVAAPFTGGASLIPSLVGAAGAGLGAAGQAAASNRGEKFNGQAELEKLLLQREQQGFTQQLQGAQENRAGTSDAWRKLLASQHVLTPAAHTQLSPYSTAPRQATDAEMQGADALSQQVLARLQGGNPITPPVQHPLAVDPNLLNAGGFEKFAGIASPALSIWSKLAQLQRPNVGTMDRYNAGL